MEKIKRAAQEIFNAREDTLPDRRARLILTMCSLILASYRELLSVMDDEKRAEQIVGKALFQTNQALGTLMSAPLLWPRKPFKFISRTPLKRISELTYGKSMGFAQERTEHSVSLIVNRCAFHQFFIDNGEPQLTQLLCLWDRNWMDPINTSDRPIKIERPTTISTGSETCQFRFVHDQLKENKETIDILPLPR